MFKNPGTPLYVLAIIFSASIGLVLGNLTHASPTAHAPHRMVELSFYIILAPSLIYLAIDYLRAGYYWFAGLFSMLAIERMYLLTILLNNASDNNQSAANGLVPVVLILSIILIRLISGRIAYQLKHLLPHYQSQSSKA